MVSSGRPGTPANGSQHESRSPVVPKGRMPVTEFLFDRPGAASPFGDDLSFPLPVSTLAYRHPATEH